MRRITVQQRRRGMVERHHLAGDAAIDRAASQLHGRLDGAVFASAIHTPLEQAIRNGES